MKNETMENKKIKDIYTNLNVENIDALLYQIEIIAPTSIQSIVDEMGRTEDIRFSPNQKKLAIAGFGQNSCIVLDIHIDRSGPKPVLHILDYIKISSDSINHPHGFEFVDNDYLIVANRVGYITVFDLKNIQTFDNQVHLKPIREVKYTGLFQDINSPGSVCILTQDDKEVDILVCNNYNHKISRHLIPLTNRWKFVKNSIFLQKGFNVPDGIAINKEKTWLAISNHFTHSVLLFDLLSKMTPNTESAGELVDAGYPHGLRFSADSKQIYVADAGSPFVNLYQSISGDWSGNHTPNKKIRVLGQETFIRGHTNPEEGGIKGIDLSAEGDLLAVTNTEMPLSIIYLPDLGLS